MEAPELRPCEDDAVSINQQNTTFHFGGVETMWQGGRSILQSYRME